MSASIAMTPKAVTEEAKLSADQRWSGLYRVSAVLLILTAVVWTIVTYTARNLYSAGFPSDPASYLQLISQHQTLANLTWILWILADLLLMAPTVAMYLVLESYNRTLTARGYVCDVF